MNIDRNRYVDRMRGLTVFLMLIVNSPIDLRITTATLKHSQWAGLTLADAVFPTFLFIVGISLSLSHSLSRINFKTIISKVVTLAFVGVLLKLMTFFLFKQEHIRLMGVLLRIGVCYGAVGLMLLYMSNKALKTTFITLFILWSTILYVWNDYNQYSNISDVLDDLILGDYANYYDVTTGRHGDSEGIFSTTGAVLTTLSGLIFGKRINNISNINGFFCGAICILVGFSLFYFLSIPVIKKLWTPSFLLICTGIAIWFYLLVKNMHYINLTCLEQIGRNSLKIYVFSIVFFEILLYLQLWHSLFVVIYINLIPKSIPIQGATFIFSLLFSSLLCFFPSFIRKIFFKTKELCDFRVFK